MISGKYLLLAMAILGSISMDISLAIKCKGKDSSVMSVVGVEGEFCVEGPACVADNKHGECPPFASCKKLDTGDYGCKPKNVEECGPDGGLLVSVEGLKGAYCVQEPVCVADNKHGNCPDFAHCGKVVTGVYGCKPNDTTFMDKNMSHGRHKKKGSHKHDHRHHKAHEKQAENLHQSMSNIICEGKGANVVSVEGVEGEFCVHGPACVADNKHGVCPDFAACKKLSSGVYGCKATAVEECPNGGMHVSVEGVKGVYCARSPVCVADVKDGNCPDFAHCGKVVTGVYGCKPNDASLAEHWLKVHESKYNDGSDTESDDFDFSKLPIEDDESMDFSDDQTSDYRSKKGKSSIMCEGDDASIISVKGVEGQFCIHGPACVADNKDGVCPDFATCKKQSTGVYGCQPTETEKCGSDDDFLVSVEGIEGAYCVQGPVCVADVRDGNCPDFAHCGKTKTNVYGCIPNDPDQIQNVKIDKKKYENDDKDAKSKDNHKEVDDDKKSSNDQTNKNSPKGFICEGDDASIISVEGVEGQFCVHGPACVADKKDGVCPNFASCEKLPSGTHGCKPKKVEPCGADGGLLVSVEGMEGAYCVQSPVCVADVEDGNCPDFAHCGKVLTGVYGCKPNNESMSLNERNDPMEVKKEGENKEYHQKSGGLDFNHLFKMLEDFTNKNFGKSVEKDDKRDETVPMTNKKSSRDNEKNPVNYNFENLSQDDNLDSDDSEIDTSVDELWKDDDFSDDEGDWRTSRRLSSMNNQRMNKQLRG